MFANFPETENSGLGWSPDSAKHTASALLDSQGWEFALVALYKRATVSNSLPSLFRSLKTSVSLIKPKSEYPTLQTVHNI